MRDVVFVAVTSGFFVVAVAYVTACGAIVGRAEPTPADGQPDDRERGDGNDEHVASTRRVG